VIYQVFNVPSHVLIKAYPAGGYQWLCIDTDSPAASASGCGSLEQCREELAGQARELWLLLPGETVSTRIMPFVARERRHNRQAMPYQLEEFLAGDIEALHFALGQWRMAAEPTGDNDALVSFAWCDRQWLQQQLQPFAELELELSAVVPEPLMLRREDGWVLRLEQTLWCHIDDGYGFAVDAELAGETLAMLYREHGLPSRLVLSAASAAVLEQLKQLVPEALRDLAETRRETLWQSLTPVTRLPAESSRLVPELDLLQADFARRLPLARWWRQWRGVAALLGVALGAWTATGVLHIQQQRAQQAQLVSQTETAFRSVVPQGVLVDAEKQLRHRVASLGSSSNTTGPVALIARIAPIIAQDKGIVLRGLSYNQRQGDIRLNCRAQSFSAIEQLLARLLEQGLQAELVHSSADGEGQQARFRIHWGRV
jgi:general secretion pathway protein L